MINYAITAKKKTKEYKFVRHKSELGIVKTSYATIYSYLLSERKTFPVNDRYQNRAKAKDGTVFMTPCMPSFFVKNTIIFTRNSH